MNILEEDYCCLSLLFKPNEEKTVVTENPLSAPQLKKETDAKVVKEKEKAFKVGNVATLKYCKQPFPANFERAAKK